MVDDWENIKIGIMEGLLWSKFSANADLAAMLLLTGNIELVELNWWNDKFWGVCDKTGEGRNELGKVLMRVREKIRDWIYVGKNERIWNAQELLE